MRVRRCAGDSHPALLTHPLFRSDPSPFSFSAEQEAIFAGWRRPSELEPRANDESVNGDPELLMVAKEEMDLAQDLATDCSVVASLCAAARHLGPTQHSVS